MRRLLVLLVAGLAAFLAATLIARAGAASTGTSFRTPDAGAACRIEGPALVCSSLGSEGSVVLRSHGRPAIARELPWWDGRTPVLRHFRHGSLSCTLHADTILCRNGTAAISAAADGFAVAS